MERRCCLLLLLILLVFHCRLTSSLNVNDTEEANDADDDIEESMTEDQSTLAKEEATDPQKILEKAVSSAAEEIRPLLKLDKSNEENEESEMSNDDDFNGDNSIAQTTRNANETIAILQRWSKGVASGMDTTFREALPIITSIGYDSNLTSACLASFLKLFTATRKQEIWAFRMLDSFGRVDSGTFDGTVTNFGEYDQCLGINFPGDEEILEDHDMSELQPSEDDEEEEKVVGKYCVMRIDIPMPPKPRKLRLHDPVIQLKGTRLENTILHYMSKTFDSLYTIKGFRYGICIPSSCSASEIENLVNKVAYPLTKAPVTIGPDKFCDTSNDPVNFNFKHKLSLGIILFFSGLVAIASLLDLTRICVNWWSSSNGSDFVSSTGSKSGSLPPQHEVFTYCSHSSSTSSSSNKSSTSWLMESKEFQVVFCFSLIENTRKLFHIRKDQGESILSAVHGMRILSMIWIIIGHTYCFGGFYKLLYTFRRVSKVGIDNPARWIYQPLINTFLLVDTFFFLGGVVLIFVALPMLEKHKGKFNYFIYAIHRWVRLTPAMVGVICFITIMPFLGSGPYWKQEMTWQSEGCQKNWWMNLLYINNWVYPVDEMCGGMTWFIAADFQIYLFVAPLIFFAYYKSSLCGLVVNFLLLIGGMVSSGVSTYVNDLEPTFVIQHTIDLSLLHEYAQFGYFPTYHHVAPYCLGTLIGYFILKNQKSSFRIPRWTQCVMWILAPAASIFVLFATKNWNTFDKQVTPTIGVSVVYSVFQRILWVTGVAWVSLMCGTGHGGIVNNILSNRLFIPFSRLSYSIYMVHLIPIFLRVNSMRYTRGWDDFEFVSWGVFNVILGISGAYLLYIVFESPINSLEKMFFRPNTSATHKNKPEYNSKNDSNNNNHANENENCDEAGCDNFCPSHGPHTRRNSEIICRQHPTEPIPSSSSSNSIPAITTFAAYKIKSCSISSGFSAASCHSLGRHHHQCPYHMQANLEKRERM